MFWIVLSVLLWGFIHSLFASLQAKEWTRRRFGERTVRFYRLAYNIFAAVSFLPVLVIAALTPDRTLYQVSMPWSGLMVFGMLLAVAALLVGFLQTDVWEFIGLRQVASGAVSLSTSYPKGNGPVETREGKLVTRGLYRYVRHPLYTAGIVFIWLMPLMTVNVLAINIALTVYVVIGAVFEERKLRREFGQEYADYAARTPMFIPFTKWNKK